MDSGRLTVWRQYVEHYGIGSERWFTSDYSNGNRNLRQRYQERNPYRERKHGNQ
jgi:hypothetical protein